MDDWKRRGRVWTAVYSRILCFLWSGFKSIAINRGEMAHDLRFEG